MIEDDLNANTDWVEVLNLIEQGKFEEKYPKYKLYKRINGYFIKKDKEKIFLFNKQREIEFIFPAEEPRKVKIFTSKDIERYIKDGEDLIGETGFTKGVSNLKKIIQSIKPEELTKIEIEDILDKFIGMADSYDKNQNRIEEAFCLANIIKINYKYLNIKDTEKLERYIERLRIIMDKKDEDKYQWYSKAKEIINNLVIIKK